ncbi:hypothetical protein ACWET9_37730 [Streptomyces sp. NPDC004059]
MCTNPESACSACGFTVAVCGGDLPSERRDQLLAEHGPATRRVSGPSAKNAVIMRVLSGDCSGTLPEMELLARGLRASGIAAAVPRA